MAVETTPGVRDLRVALPAAAAWIGAALLVGSPERAGWVVLIGAAAVCGGIAWLVLRRPQRALGLIGIVVVAAAFCTVVAVAVVVGDARRSPVALDGAGTVTVEVVLTRDLAPGDRSVVGTLVGAGDTEGLHVPVRVVPAGTGADGPIAAGSRLCGTAVLEPDEPGNATAYVAFLRGAVRTTPPTGLLAATDRARQAFVAVTRALPEPGASLLRGLAIGDRSGLDPGTEAAMETSALTHLTAVSGSNCAVIVGLVVVLGRFVGLSRVARAAAAIALLGAFVVLVRPDPSIVRATVMAVVVLVVHLAGRPVRGVPLIALAVVGMLVADPWYARSFAFALSVLATSGIVVLGPPLTAVLATRLRTPLAAALAIPVAAQVACWPVTIPLSAAFPTYAVPANLLTEPLAPIVTVVGLGACVLAPLWPWGASVLAAIAWAPATAIAGIAHGAAALPVAAAPWPAGVTGVAAAAVVSACIAVAILTPGAVRFRLLVAAGAVTAIGLVSVAVPRIVVRAGLPGDWAIAACDVGQGDAVVIRGGTGVAMVDVGDDPERLGACLDLLGVDRVDLLVLTHFDRDHVGAVASVTDRVRTALVGPTGRPEDERVRRSLVDAGIDVRTADDTTAGTLGPLRWRLLWPRAGAGESGNAASLVLRTEPGPDCPSCVSGLFLGDLGETAQRRLRGVLDAEDAADRVPIDVVKVSHHGSADQDPLLYRETAAAVGLIGVGADNTYGHPTRSALEMLDAAGTRAYRTDLLGTIVVGRDGSGGLRVWTERSAPGSPRGAPGSPQRDPSVPALAPGRDSRRRWQAVGAVSGAGAVSGVRSVSGVCAASGVGEGRPGGALGVGRRP